MYFPGQSIPLHFPQDREGAYILLVTRKGSLSLILISYILLLTPLTIPTLGLARNCVSGLVLLGM